MDSADGWAPYWTAWSSCSRVQSDEISTGHPWVPNWASIGPAGWAWARGPGYIKPRVGTCGFDLLCVSVRTVKISSIVTGAKESANVVGRSGVRPRRDLWVGGGTEWRRRGELVGCRGWDCPTASECGWDGWDCPTTSGCGWDGWDCPTTSECGWDGCVRWAAIVCAVLWRWWWARSCLAAACGCIVTEALAVGK